MKNTEIANKLGVSASQIAKWKSQDKWNTEALPNKKIKSNNPTKTKGNKKGAPKGNKNAVGKDSGAPVGNKYSLKHGGYSQIYWDTLDEDEKSLIEDMPKTEEKLLLEQIKLYAVRERRLMKAIKKIKEESQQVLSGVVRIDTKRSFEMYDEAEKKDMQVLYKEKVDELIDKGERLPGTSYQITTSTENKQNIISRLEAELTKIQRAKTQAIDSLAKLNLENQKIELLKDKNDVEIEDTDEIDELIYG